jgi:hypothetical protein
VRDERGSWYLLTGLVLGLAFGLVYAWVISPRAYGDTSPAYLRADFKDRYRAMIALAFSANGNLPRAQARLNLLSDPNVPLAVVDQARRGETEGSPAREVEALELMATALAEQATPLSPAGQPTGSPSFASPSPLADTPQVPLAETAEESGSEPTTEPEGDSSPTSESPASAAILLGTSTTTPVSGAAPTRTPSPMPEALFVLEESSFVCDKELDQPLIQVLAQDGAGNPLPGVEVLVVWEGGEDHFFTGLKPELGPGYADFTMVPGTEYTLRLASGGPPVPDLTAAECEGEGGSRFWGAWSLVFTLP